MTHTPPVTNNSNIEPGSFRDRNGRIYYFDDAIYSGISSRALEEWKALASTKFFRRAMEDGKLVGTEEADPKQIPDPALANEWAGILKHERIPFISYPYEWTFGMLKDAALLQLDLLASALKENMTMKDATSFNIQWIGSRPVFIDIPSFERLVPGSPWSGYRQFCTLFLYPLFLQAYKNISYHARLRGNIDGIDPEECNNMMSLRDLLRPGVFTDVFLQAKMEKSYADSSKHVKEDLKKSGFNAEMIKTNVRRLQKIIGKLTWKQAQSEWSDYATHNSYTETDGASKEAFVRTAVIQKRRNLVWDLGANTGRYSRIAAENSQYVVAMDSDHLAVERFYIEMKEEKNRNILPLVMNLADSSPNLGWRGLERKSLQDRGKPDLILCLALIHHIVISANIPVHEFIDWLASFQSDLIIEFITKDDPMAKTLLRNKDDQYADYELGNFEKVLASRFTIAERKALSSGTRYLFHAHPRINQ